MSNQVILFLLQEKVGIIPKTRVIPTFWFFSANTMEPKSSSEQEKCEIGHSYRSFTGYRSGNQNRLNRASLFSKRPSPPLSALCHQQPTDSAFMYNISSHVTHQKSGRALVV